MVLLSAVVDTSPEGYHPAELGALAAPLSPLDHLVAGLPPTLVVHSKSDDVCPAAGAERLVARSRDLGNTIDAIYADHAGHGFYTDADTARSVALSEGRFYPAVVSEFLSAPPAEEVGRRPR